MSKFDEKVTRKNLFDYKEENLPFKKLSELKAEKGEGPFVLKALWIYFDKSGKVKAHPVAVIEGLNIDLPDYRLQDVEDMLQDPETIEQINKGECGFKIGSYSNKFGTFCSADWCKIEKGVPFEV